MNDVASNHKRGSSGNERVVASVLQITLLFLLASLLVVLAGSGCGVDQGVADLGGPDEDVDTGSESAGEESKVGETDIREKPGVGATDPPEDANTVSVFPLHDAPLKTDNGGYYFAGRLVLHEGCLRLEVPPDAYGQIRVENPNGADEPRRMGLIIWPSGFGSRVEGGSVSVVDADGRTFARVGDHVRLTHATIYYPEAEEQGLLRGMSEDCDGPFYLVGDEVAVFDPDDEPTTLRLPDPEVFFPRRRTGRPTRGLFRHALGTGELVLNGPCLQLGAGTTIVWPAGFEPHVKDGVVQVRNWAGQVIAQVGDRIAGGGGFSSSGYGDCPGNTFEIHSIEVLPDGEGGKAGGESAGETGSSEDAAVVATFPQHNALLGTDNGGHFFAGRLVLNKGCLRAEIPPDANGPGLSVLPIWPSGYALSVDDEAVAIVDASGETAATVGDHIRLSRSTISFEEAQGQACFGGCPWTAKGPISWWATKSPYSIPIPSPLSCGCQTRM